MMAVIAAAQMKSTDSLEENLEQIDMLASTACQKQAKLLVLPEECLTLSMKEEEKLALSKQLEPRQRLSQIAEKHKIWLVAGSVPTDFSNGKYYASCLVFDDKGKLQVSYHKIHLFDVEVEQGTSYFESKTVKPGKDIQLVNTPCGRVGLSICYDVRFPELYRTYMLQGAEILGIPSAFTPQTGIVHWHTLLKARAIENLSYVIAPNQVGTRPNGEGTYGHSLIMGPWGDILGELEKGIGVITANVDLSELKKIRALFPALNHHRLLV